MTAHFRTADDRSSSCLCPLRWRSFRAGALGPIRSIAGDLAGESASANESCSRSSPSDGWPRSGAESSRKPLLPR